jgi:hypothetical protein
VSVSFQDICGFSSPCEASEVSGVSGACFAAAISARVL